MLRKRLLEYSGHTVPLYVVQDLHSALQGNCRAATGAGSHLPVLPRLSRHTALPHVGAEACPSDWCEPSKSKFCSNSHRKSMAGRGIRPNLLKFQARTMWPLVLLQWNLFKKLCDECNETLFYTCFNTKKTHTLSSNHFTTFQLFLYPTVIYFLLLLFSFCSLSCPVLTVVSVNNADVWPADCLSSSEAQSFIFANLILQQCVFWQGNWGQQISGNLSLQIKADNMHLNSK